jgi:hypothetical protein
MKGNSKSSNLAKIEEVFRFSCYLASEVSTIITAEGVAEDLDLVLVMHTRNALHQMGGWMIAKVGAHITNSQATIAGIQVLRVRIWWLVQHINLKINNLF